MNPESWTWTMFHRASSLGAAWIASASGQRVLVERYPEAVCGARACAGQPPHRWHATGPIAEGRCGRGMTRRQALDALVTP